MLELILLTACQTPLHALASTSADSRLPQDPIVQDDAWIRRVEGPPGAKTYLSHHAQMALLSDLDGDGVFDAPGGIDALSFWPRPTTTTPCPIDFVFSMSSNLGPFKDGDLLRHREGQGVEIVVAEDDFLALLLPASGSFDLDAASYDPATDELWFSVADNLTGTVLGDVLDGDILCWQRTTGTLTLRYTEADIQSFVDLVTGGGTAIGDVLALSHVPATGELAFVVQSPSNLDASVLALDLLGLQAPRILPGWNETDWDFQQATEIDALAFVGSALPQPPVLDFDLPFFAPGDIVGFRLRHGVPGTIAHGLRAVRTAYDPRPGQGIGFLFLDPTDPHLIAQVTHGNTQPQVVDPSGSASYNWTVPSLPPGLAILDLYFQAWDQIGGWSAPVVLRIQ